MKDHSRPIPDSSPGKEKHAGTRKCACAAKKDAGYGPFQRWELQDFLSIGYRVS